MHARSIVILVLAAAGMQVPAQDKAPAAAKPLALVVANTGKHVLHGVYVAPFRAASWGKNLLGDRSLKTGDTAEIQLASGCGTYNVRLVAEDGIEFLDDEVAFCQDEDLLIVGESDLTKASARNYSRAQRAKQ